MQLRSWRQRKEKRKRSRTRRGSGRPQVNLPSPQISKIRRALARAMRVSRSDGRISQKASREEKIVTGEIRKLDPIRPV